MQAEDGGLGGRGLWKGGTDGMSPGGENDAMKRYLAGDLGKGGAAAAFE